MKTGLDRSIASLEIVVTPEMSATLNGKLIHNVYSTFYAALHIESVARLALEPYLEEFEEGIGSALSVTHHSMAAIGATLIISAEITAVRGIYVDAYVTIEEIQSRTLIAEGTQTQVVLPKIKVSSLVGKALR